MADLIALAKEFSTTAVGGERGDDSLARMREPTAGSGEHSVLECVGHEQAVETALGFVRAGGAIGRVFVTAARDEPVDFSTDYRNITFPADPAPHARTSRSCCRTCSRARRLLAQKPWIVPIPGTPASPSRDRGRTT